MQRLLFHTLPDGSLALAALTIEPAPTRGLVRLTNYEIFWPAFPVRDVSRN